MTWRYSMRLFTSLGELWLARGDLAKVQAPIPALEVEIDLSQPSLDKLPMAAALGVPELWRYSHEQVIM